ncbi:hypothetical protein KM043_001616 [Ampulex compressa]|nr:hypothetical protein KM043_001616 [Ampulex compressa]
MNDRESGSASSMDRPSRKDRPRNLASSLTRSPPASLSPPFVMSPCREDILRDGNPEYGAITSLSPADVYSPLGASRRSGRGLEWPRTFPAKWCGEN